ncbi:hypothetical protein [Janibacter hoylei]|uniref:hypothetical protein n=1 Tax=Janibacter hoylei TaxID=364298 RepID=UPI0012EAA9A1|nr:hypothetical protein [Janibacter hoylei]
MLRQGRLDRDEIDATDAAARPVGEQQGAARLPLRRREVDPGRALLRGHLRGRVNHR